MKKLIILLLAISLWVPLQGQPVTEGQQIPQGAVVYSLPRTCVRIVAEASYASFSPGPYARYARKFLGIEAGQAKTTTYELSRIEMTPMLEADPHQLYVVNLSAGNAQPWFLQLTSQGLVLLSDSYAAKENHWRFPSLDGSQEVSDAGIIENLKEERTTLYRSQIRGQEVSAIPVQQTQLVEKTLEQRAEEAARKVFDLRNMRYAIITGDTDALYSGEAMGAAVEEMRRMEEEYLKLFLGETTTGKTHLSTDVLPDVENTRYVAFRFSETEGLLPAGNVGGRPIVLEVDAAAQEVIPRLLADEGRIRTGTRLYYRQPVITMVRLTDGQKELLQARIPLYQKGPVLNFIIN
ncbi:MAG TPA: DUF4831 family protein [Bacteroidales bacterium]|nr:MAG: hypothetical protein BWX93_01268 [Bacteroidetes bacterium ADurb.Bin139]HOG25097.1 DUF4831 family protein [Bacteroidales bacterium]HOR11994.1 DUF4831 family protein [Bacteroidales bacterium]HOZ19598.1 DUF4831 family protein [Bacteroidales bacterium]HPK39187.1 DUF4831 family protein [Bacteroidales bacterium]